MITPIAERPAAWLWQNSITPTSTRNNLPYNCNESFTARPSIGQRTSIPNQSVMPPGPVESPTVRYKAAARTPLSSEERANGLYTGSEPYSALDSSELGRRKSADPGSLGAPYNRPGTLGGRHLDINASPFAGQFGDSAYALAKALQTGSDHRRSSYAQPIHAPVSAAAEPARGPISNYSNDVSHVGLSDALGGLKIEDSSEHSNRFSRNGDYQFVPSQSTPAWQPDMNGNTTNPEFRLYQDSSNGDTPWKSPYPGLRNRTTPEVRMESSYLERKQGSMERNSPASNSHRTSFDSSRHLSGALNSRSNGSWNPSPLRNSQDIERPLQGLGYSHQPPGYQYPYEYMPQFAPSLDPYAPQIPHYRQPGPASGYGLPINYHTNFPLQPSRSKESSQNARSPILDNYRNTHKTRKWELNVSST